MGEGAITSTRGGVRGQNANEHLRMVGELIEYWKLTNDTLPLK